MRNPVKPPGPIPTATRSSCSPEHAGGSERSAQPAIGPDSSATFPRSALEATISPAIATALEKLPRAPSMPRTIMRAGPH